MHQQFKGISLSHYSAPVEIRELFAMDESTSKRIMFQLKEILNLSEVIILSTCNRTEIYYSSTEDLSAEIISLVSIHKGIAESRKYIPYFEIIINHKEAVLHLFEVSMGLRSQVVGDIQISNQVKNAYQWSADMNMAGPFLHRLMHTIFYTNKRVVQETSFRDGAASVSYATVELIELLCTDIVEPKILILGIGEIGSDVCKNLVGKHTGKVAMVNRTLSKISNLAEECKFDIIEFENIWKAIDKFDIIISSIAKDEPFITKKELSNLNLLSHKFFIDLAVPRSIESSIEEKNGIVLYNIDDIHAKANKALQKRMSATPQVKKIINESVVGLDEWNQEMAVSPTINKLKNALEHIRQEEIGRYVKNLSDEETDHIDKITKSIMQKILKIPVLQLKAACKRGEAETLIDVLNDLFDLEKQIDKA